MLRRWWYGYCEGIVVDISVVDDYVGSFDGEGCIFDCNESVVLCNWLVVDVCDDDVYGYGWWVGLVVCCVEV